MVQLVVEIKFNNTPEAICHHKEYTYVCMTGGEICRIDYEGPVQSSFIKLAATASIRAHGDRLYCLQKSSPNKLLVYDLSGHLMTSWEIQSALCTSPGNKLCGVTDTKDIVILDPTNRQILFYGIDGKLTCQLACADISATSENLSSFYHEGRIFISNFKLSIVFCVNEATGSVEWTFNTGTAKPRALIRYNERCLLVAVYGIKVNLFLLDMDTGNPIIIFMTNNDK